MLHGRMDNILDQVKVKLSKVVHSDDISFISRRGKYKNHKGEGDGLFQ